MTVGCRELNPDQRGLDTAQQEEDESGHEIQDPDFFMIGRCDP
jgi:hypothetical protein